MAKSVIERLRRRFAGKTTFSDSASYWEQRYARGGHSGAGSYSQLADFKARFLNAYVEKHGIEHVLELGSGDGNQLTLAHYPRYTGLDISASAVAQCRERFADDDSKQFFLLGDYKGEPADLVLSLDVIYHLVEDTTFEDYMTRLFDHAEQRVIIFSSNVDDTSADFGTHVRQRRFSDWIERERPVWRESEHVPNEFPYTGDHRTGSFADFHVYERT